MIKFTKEQLSEIKFMYESGISMQDIANKFGVSRPTIKKRLDNLNVSIRAGHTAAIASENQTKICKICGEELPLEAFNKGNAKFGRRTICRTCEHKQANTDEVRERKRLRRQERSKNDAEYKKKRQQVDLEKLLKDDQSYIKYLVRNAKRRAKLKNIPFNIDFSDLTLPKTCPLLGIELKKHLGEGNYVQDDCPTIDRIIPELGYVKGNVQIISQKANRIKSNASYKEVLSVAENLQKLIH